MLIYNTNFDEKLLYYAQSMEFLKYNSPFCDLVDDPLLEGNFRMAICFNKAINGNLSARECVSNTLMLCSGEFTPYTLIFYRDKMMSFPIFETEIQRIRYTLANIDSLPDVYEGVDPNNADFYKQLKAASLNCVNALCDPFYEISTSVGKVSQFFPTANSTSVFSFGPLKDAFASITNGVDLTVLNNIPIAFKEGALELSKRCSDIWGAVQGSFVNTEDKPDFLLNTLDSKTLRLGEKRYRYTPDLASYNNYAIASTNVLADIAVSLGGCFKRYEFLQRYNPYDTNHNMRETSIVPTLDIVNNEQFSRNRAGQTESGNVTRTNSNLGVNYIPSSKSIYTDSVIITPTRPVYATGGYVQSRYTVFGAWLDEEEKTVWVDPTVLSKADIYTLEGKTFLGKLMTPSIAGSFNNDAIGKALANKEGDITSFQAGYVRDYLQGYTTNTDLTNRKQNQFNHGIAINHIHFNASLPDKSRHISANTFKQLCKENKLFALVNGTLINVFDRKGVADRALALDFTPYAFYKAANNQRAWTYKNEIKYTNGWTQKTITGVKNIGTLTVRFCIGEPQKIIEQLNLLQSPTQGYIEPPRTTQPTLSSPIPEIVLGGGFGGAANASTPPATQPNANIPDIFDTPGGIPFTE